MPTLRQMVDQMLKIEEQSDHKEGAYPVWFKNEFYQIGFILLLRWERFKIKLKYFRHKPKEGK